MTRLRSHPMPSWTQSFDVYLAHVDGAPTSFVVDMNAREHAPVATHPLRIQVRVALLRPLPNGLRDASELDALGLVEDTVVSSLENELEAIYVGRFLGDGYATFVFYAPAEAEEDVDDLGAVIGSLGEYTAEWLAEEDPEWGFYADFLYPDPESQERMMNRAQLQQRREIGDRLDIAREIDHLAIFPSREQAEAAAKVLSAAGFRVDEITARDDDDGFAMEFHRDETLTADRPDEFCAEIRDILTAHEGDYDGWGGLVVKGDALLRRRSPPPRAGRHVASFWYIGEISCRVRPLLLALARCCSP